MNPDQVIRLSLRLLGAAILLGASLCWGQQFSISTIAGCGSCFQPNLGDGGPAVNGSLSLIADVAVDTAGNLYIADSYNNRIRKVTPAGVITTVAGNGALGSSGDGGSAILASLSTPGGVAVDASGNVYISDTGNNRIRKLSPDGIIRTIVGTGGNGFSGDGGLATAAQISSPAGLAVDGTGNVYIADYYNDRIRKVSPSGIIATVAGNGSCCLSGDGGPAVNGYLQRPAGISLDGLGNLYIADSNHETIRKVSSIGTITTVAGSGAYGFKGDGGPAIVAQLAGPRHVAVDTAGNLFISDWGNNRIRMVSPDGTITTIAGGGLGCSTQTNSVGDGCPATSARFIDPEGLVTDPFGNIYVADSVNQRVRFLKLSAAIPVIKSGGVVSATAFGQFAAVAPGSWIEIYGSNFANHSRSWASADFVGPNAPTSLDGTFVTIAGQKMFVDYISPGQVNVQVPTTVATGRQQLMVSTAIGTSDPYAVTVNATQPGLLALPSFAVGTRQYITALFSDATTFVLPPTVPGVPSRRARPGDIITLYGVGFGPVSPSIPAGQIVPQSNTLTLPLQIFIGQVTAPLSYSGLTPGTVGLYQFNVIVPTIPSSDVAPVTFSLGGVIGTQALYTAVQN